MQSNREEAVVALLDASRALVAISARSVAEDRSGVTLPQFRMLVVVSGGPRTLGELAGELDVVPSTAARMVDRLVDAGLLDRTVPPEDRRTTRLSLTARGRRTVTVVTDRRRRALEAVVARVPSDDLAALARAAQVFVLAAEADGAASGS